MQNPAKDASIAFGTVMTFLMVWSFISMTRKKQGEDKQIESLHKKLDLLLTQKGKK